MLVFALVGVADPVELRGSNGNIARVEIISIERDKLVVRRPGSEACIHLEWDKLDLDWLKKNQPEIWKKREELRRSAPSASQSEKSENLFAKESPPQNPAELARRMLAALNDPILCLQPWEASKRKSSPETISLPPDVLRKNFEELLEAGVTASALVRMLFVTQSLENTGTVQRDLEKLAVGYQRDAKKRSDGSIGNVQEFLRAQEFSSTLADKKPSLRPGPFLKALNEQDATARAAYLLLVNQARLRDQAIAVLRKYESFALNLPDPTREVVALRHSIARVIVVLEKMGKNASSRLDRNTQTDCADLMNKLAALAK